MEEGKLSAWAALAVRGASHSPGESRHVREELGRRLAELLDARTAAWISLPPPLRRRLYNTLLECPLWLLEQTLRQNEHSDSTLY